jgi:uracil-DNA glycosylase
MLAMIEHLPNAKIDPSWNKLLKNEFDSTYFAQLSEFVRGEYASGTCYPPIEKVFNAFNSCPISRVKVVIIGQDPYINPNQANGLSFSVEEGGHLPPSLVNIFKEVSTDLGVARPTNGDLTRWAAEGVLLLNATLTVRAGASGSHQRRGWENFTQAAIDAVNSECDHLVFMLWGAPAQKNATRIDPSKHLVLQAPHPSPLSAYRGFFGCKHFSRANTWLIEKGLTPVRWY